MIYRHKGYRRSFTFNILALIFTPLFILMDAGFIWLLIDSDVNLFEALLGILFMSTFVVSCVYWLVYTVKVTETSIEFINLFKKRKVIDINNINNEMELYFDRFHRITAFNLKVTDKSNHVYIIRYVNRRFLDYLLKRDFIIPDNEVVKKFYLI